MLTGIVSQTDFFLLLKWTIRQWTILCPNSRDNCSNVTIHIHIYIYISNSLYFIVALFLCYTKASGARTKVQVQGDKDEVLLSLLHVGDSSNLIFTLMMLHIGKAVYGGSLRIGFSGCSLNPS